jgi:hypothetical protein
MEFMRPLAVGKERQKQQHSSRTTGQSVTQSTSHPSHHYPSIVTIFINNIHNHQSFEPIMHPGGWCTYLCRVLGERARSHRQRRALRIYRSTILHERINSESSTNQRNYHKDKQTQPRSTRASSSKWHCQRKGGAPNHSHINLPLADARKVSNRIDDATRGEAPK